MYLDLNPNFPAFIRPFFVSSYVKVESVWSAGIIYSRIRERKQNGWIL